MDGSIENMVLENIKSRRSIKAFRKDPVPGDIVEKIVEAGRFAPSALNMQPWKFIIVDDRQMIEEFASIARARIKKLYKLMPLVKIFKKSYRDQRAINAIKKTAESSADTVFYSAPLVIFIANDATFGETDIDCYLAAENMMLAANSLGIGSCFIGRGKAIPAKLLRKKFDLPDNYDFNVFIAFGYPKDHDRTAPARKVGTVKRI